MQLLRILTILTFVFATTVTCATTTSLIRGRELSDSDTNKLIPCGSREDGICKCPGPCMDVYKNTTCILKKCYNWDANLETCKEAGPEYTSAIVLQAIPFTGVFGAGLGNMGRWDLFAIGSGIWGGGFILVCLFSCAGAICEKDGGAGTSACISCIGSLMSIGMLVYYIWGIVVIAQKTVLGPNGCPLH